MSKLHTNMSHPPRERMIKLLKAAKSWDTRTETILEQIYTSCTSLSCRARSELGRVNKVGWRMATVPGQVVGIDLKVFDRADAKKWKDIVYIFDFSTDFAVADVINNKSPGEIVDKIEALWEDRSLPAIQNLISDFLNSQKLDNSLHLLFLS